MQIREWAYTDLRIYQRWDQVPRRSKHPLLTGNHVLIYKNIKVNNVLNVIIIQRANTKSCVGQHGPPTNAKVGSGAAEEGASPADWSHPL
jgi:hypothetical protein